MPGECLLPGLLADFHHEYPGVHVRATVSDSRSVVQDLERGSATVGLVGREPDSPRLRCLSLGTDSLVLVVAAGRRFILSRGIGNGEVSAESFLPAAHHW